jgi:DNA-binding XRE family transcriptional regulator
MKLTLKACRINVGATAKEMAMAIGVTDETIYNWESGKYAPRAKQIVKILKFFADKGFPIALENINFLP